MDSKEIELPLESVAMENDREFRKVTAPLPKWLALVLDEFCVKSGFAKQRVIAAGIKLFLGADLTAQSEYYRAAYEQADGAAKSPTAPASTVGEDAARALGPVGKKRKVRRGA